MKVSVDYTSFNLSKGTESIELTAHALQFFKDHNISFTEVFVDSFVGAKETRIVWNEDVMPFDLPISTCNEMQEMAGKYKFKFEVSDFNQAVKIKF
jgi:hypothetical protein